ncbi:MAG: DUF1573 domain-containing protein [Bacteroidetes bacterium]|jgi:hypothetical protein|nr:DUF1573 domain-containing protein [Bacteroidota bacterium]
MMKPFDKFFLLSFLLFMTLMSAQDSNALIFEEDTCDYGSLKVGDTAECIFNFKNTSKTVIKIIDIKSNSRHIEFELSKDTINPSEKGQLTVIYNCKVEGPIRKTITIFTDTKPDVYTVLVKGRILPKP